MSHMVIAVDGPSAAGKGTLARRLAAHYGLAYLDTGLLYRAVAARLARQGKDFDDVEAATAAARKISQDDLDDPRLRDEAVSQGASRVAAMAPVREALVEFQRRFAAAPPEGARGALLDGRDIGTVICPDAAFKLFVTASPEVRARRRHREILERGGRATLAEVESEMAARDARDASRAAAPLAAAPDAHLLDTTNLDIDAAFAAARAYIDAEPR